MMTREQVQTYTKHRVMELSHAQDHARKEWKAGRLTQAEFMDRHTVAEQTKRAYQRMCAAVIAGEP